MRAGLAAAAPAFIKAHSYGEFVFDFSWAEAYTHFGRNYYPKLSVCVPFTPATGARLLVRPDLDGPESAPAAGQGHRGVRGRAAAVLGARAVLR